MAFVKFMQTQSLTWTERWRAWAECRCTCPEVPALRSAQIDMTSRSSGTSCALGISVGSTTLLRPTMTQGRRAGRAARRAKDSNVRGLPLQTAGAPRPSADDYRR